MRSSFKSDEQRKQFVKEFAGLIYRLFVRPRVLKIVNQYKRQAIKKKRAARRRCGYQAHKY